MGELFVGNDVEELHELVSAQFAPHRLRVLADEGVDGRFHLAHEGAVSLFVLGYGAEVEVVPDRLPDIYNVHLPLAGGGALIVDGDEVDAASVVGPGQRLRMRWSADSTTLIVRIGRDALDRALTEHLGDTPNRPVRFTPTLNFRDEAARQWAGWARSMVDASGAGLLRRSPLAARHFEQTLVHGLLTFQPHELSASLSHDGVTAPAAVRRALAFCEENAGEAISVGDIAAAARTSVRSLHEAFRSHVGTPPMAHLRTVRLRRAHEDLVAIAAADGVGRVTDVALRWGFLHLGRFSQLYREHYGHSPSATLRGDRPDSADRTARNG
ncbi:AraC family transcriptional regulator [Allokutzneria oryzae]|uniref:AraC family transcriptional regulator n=1 Tax=Allokutzneria oryzae TaxID=1378989 RepID=A0ABV6A9P1_9PSEU